MTRIAVVFGDQGSAPATVALGLERLGETLFVVADTPLNRARRELIEAFGPVVWLTGDLAVDVRAVEAARPDGIVTFCEQMLRTTADLADGLGLPFHDGPTAAVLTDKLAQRRRLRESGVDDLWFAAVASPEAIPGVLGQARYPVVVKPRAGLASADVCRVPDAATGERVLRTAMAAQPGAGFLVEELLPDKGTAPFGDILSVESFVAADGIAHLVTRNLPYAEPFRVQGQHTPAGLDAALEAEVASLAERAVRALGVRSGITHTEVKLTPSGPRLVEVNGRVGGYVPELYSRALGIDMVELAGQFALGRPDPPALRRPDKVYFQYQNQAPLRPCRYEGVRNVAELLGRQGIDDYVPAVRPGTELAGGIRTVSLDLVTGSVPDFDAMFAAVDTVLDTLTYTFGFDGVPRDVTARELPSW